MRKFIFALAASAALAVVSVPALALDLPTLPGSYTFGGAAGSGVAIVLGRDNADITLNAQNLKGGSGGGANSLAVGKDTISFSQGGAGGSGGADITGHEGTKLKATINNAIGGAGGVGLSIMATEKLKVDLPGIGSVVLK